MGGGGKGGGGAQIPKFVTESQKRLGEMAKETYGITKPVMSEAAKQMHSMMSTGGRGAQVPIINNIETANQLAYNTANKQIGEAMGRGSSGKVADPSFGRIQQELAREHTAARHQIAPRIAAPFVSAGMGAAFGGPGMAQQAYQSAAGALTSGIRRPEGGNNLMDSFKKLGGIASEMKGGKAASNPYKAAGTGFADWGATGP